MCLGVYILSDHELPTVAKSRPAFQIVNVADAGLTWHFGHKFFYRALCHMGCGCGFEHDRWSGVVDENGEIKLNDHPESHASRLALADYLSSALQNQTAVEVLIGYSGSPNQLERPLYRRRAQPADFTSDYTLFDMAQVVVVSEQDTEQYAAEDRPRETRPFES